MEEKGTVHVDSNLRTKIGMLAAGAAAFAIILAGALPSAAESDLDTPPSATTSEPTLRPTSPTVYQNAHGSGW
ncbi:hypothetical protein [Nonomuraea longicatena]|uniref:Uncharacterized protein n=1 Tax=Nonomuraea longicatena TaxID=83682 RepID=A0ABN1NY86_9ACTN